MKKHILVIILSILIFSTIHAQDWTLRLRSNVEIRTWTLTSAAQKNEKPLKGATITLLKGSTIVGQTTSDENGDFEIDVPPNDDFMMSVSFSGCNTKKFFVTTKDVPDDIGKDNYKPTFGIGGFVMAKPFSGVDYIGLSEPLVKVEYKSKGRNFDHDDAVTNNGLDIVSKIYNSENTLIQKFCNLNKMGDEALRKKNCPLAKECYTKAKALIEGESYPVEQLEKVGECLKQKELEAEVAKADAAAKAEAAKIANDKAIAEKAAKEKALFDKAAADRASKEKALAEKNNKNTGEKSTSNKTTTKNTESVGTQKKTGDNSSTKTFSYQTNSNKEAPKNTSKGNSKYKIPSVIGTDKYKENITKADDYYKTKRYSEAKASYEEALKIKPNDTYAKNKIEECNKHATLK